MKIKIDRETKIAMLKALKDGEIEEKALNEILRNLGKENLITIEVIDRREQVEAAKALTQ